MSATPGDDRGASLETVEAMTYCLWEIIRDRRLNLLDDLLSRNNWGFGGDPGWELERRDPQSEASSGSGTAWPAHTEFHASLDPGAGPDFKHPECFMTRMEFADFALTMFANHFDDVHGKTVAARRILAKGRADAATVLEKLKRLRSEGQVVNRPICARCQTSGTSRNIPPLHPAARNSAHSGMSARGAASSA